MHVIMGYPSEGSEIEILHLVQSEDKKQTGPTPEPIAQQAVFAAREAVLNIHTSDSIEKYIVALIEATREPKKFNEELAGWIEFGASPRGSLALHRTSRAAAWLADRDYVTPDDVRAVAHGCLRHRLVLSYEAGAQGVTPDRVIDRILELVAVA